MGKYEKLGMDHIRFVAADFEGNYEGAVVSLKVLDTIAENTQDLPIKEALIILEDAKKLLLQMVGI